MDAINQGRPVWFESYEGIRDALYSIALNIEACEGTILDTFNNDSITHIHGDNRLFGAVEQ